MRKLKHAAAEFAIRAAARLRGHVPYGKDRRAIVTLFRLLSLRNHAAVAQLP